MSDSPLTLLFVSAGEALSWHPRVFSSMLHDTASIRGRLGIPHAILAVDQGANLSGRRGKDLPAWLEMLSHATRVSRESIFTPESVRAGSVLRLVPASRSSREGSLCVMSPKYLEAAVRLPSVDCLLLVLAESLSPSEWIRLEGLGQHHPLLLFARSPYYPGTPLTDSPARDVFERPPSEGAALMTWLQVSREGISYWTFAQALEGASLIKTGIQTDGSILHPASGLPRPLERWLKGTQIPTRDHASMVDDDEKLSSAPSELPRALRNWLSRNSPSQELSSERELLTGTAGSKGEVYGSRPISPEGAPVFRGGSVPPASGPLRLLTLSGERSDECSPPVLALREPCLLPQETTPLEPHLNVFFPDHPGTPVPLVEKEPATICVDIGPPRGEAGAQVSSGFSREGIGLLYAEPHVEVMLLCAAADIDPWHVRLELPPPTQVARFRLTPRRAGPMTLEVLLMIAQETIHRAECLIEARPVGSRLGWLGDMLEGRRGPK